MTKYKINENKDVEILEEGKVVSKYSYKEVIENAIEYYAAAGKNLSEKQLENMEYISLVEDTLEI